MFLQSISGCVLIDLRIPLLGQPGVLLKYIYGYKLSLYIHHLFQLYPGAVLLIYT